jgi:3-oxoacyl-[acyl-carrier-protein] synthase II
MNNRVVITGLGVISPLGLNINEFWENLINGKNGITINTRINTDNFKTKIAG